MRWYNLQEQGGEEMDKEFKEMFGLILNKLDGLETRLDRVETRLDRVESRLDRVESRLDGLESRQDEIYSIVKAIEHNSLVHRVDIDNLKIKASHFEGMISAIGNVITSRKATLESIKIK